AGAGRLSTVRSLVLVRARGATDISGMQSVEWKAEVRDPSIVRALVRRMGGVCASVADQSDTYYRVIDGTLLKREVEGEPPEFVHYVRPPGVRPRHARFTLYSEEQAAERFGVRPLPVWVVVEKRRECWLLDGVRIHLDNVESLGTFVELEVLVTPDQRPDAGEEKIARLRERLGPFVGEPVARGYAELLALELETDDSAA
ncbi:MAG: class IV adenylate cyclase, partial [Planctomycetota bacterium]